MKNPFDNIMPSLGPFASVLERPIGILLSLLWFGWLLYSIIHLGSAIAKLAKNRHNHRPDAAETAATSLIWPIVSLIGSVLLPVIVGVLLAMGQ